MYGTPASAAIFATRSAILRACDSDSITQGPAIKNSGFPPPRRKVPKDISRTLFMKERRYHSTLKVVQAVVRGSAVFLRGGTRRNLSGRPSALYPRTPVRRDAPALRPQNPWASPHSGPSTREWQKVQSAG